MVVSSTDSRSASNHTVASFLVSGSEGKKLSDCNLLLGNSGFPRLAGSYLCNFLEVQALNKCVLFS